MPSGVAESRSRPPTWLLPVLLLAAVLSLVGAMGRPFHADEAGQWSLAADARPHSLTGDRFHGPTLGLVTRAAHALAGAEVADAPPWALRAVPAAFLLSLVLLPWVLPIGRRQGALAALLALPLVPLSARFIQESLMVVALVWAAALWVRSGPGGETRPRLLAGLAAGFALACKVTAALHLGLAALALLALRRTAPGWKGFLAFALGLTASWALWQGSFLTDLPALGTWWTQLARAFGVATGLAEPPLPMIDALPWFLSGALLALALALRFVGAPKDARGHPADALLAAAASGYLFHLALPYKTPWLLMTADAALLTLVLPSLLAARGRAIGAACLLLALSTMLAADRQDYAETKADVPALAAALEDPASRPALILVRGDHPWPLPFYLRRTRVAYGSVPDPSEAGLWLLQASGGDPPVAPGRRAVPFALRENELWWAVAPEPLAARLEAALRPTR